MKTFLIFLNISFCFLVVIQAARVSPEVRQNVELLSRQRRQGYYDSGYDRYQQEREQQQQEQQQRYEEQQNQYEEERQQQQKYQEERQQQQQQYQEEMQKQREEQEQRYQQEQQDRYSSYGGYGYGRYKRSSLLERLRRNVPQNQGGYFRDFPSGSPVPSTYMPPQQPRNYQAAQPAVAGPPAPMIPVAVYEINFNICRYLMELIISILGEMDADDTQTAMPIQTDDQVAMQPGLVVVTASPEGDTDNIQVAVPADTAQIQLTENKDGVKTQLDEDTDLMIDVS